MNLQGTDVLYGECVIMFLAELKIKNFRKIENLTIKFKKGLNIIIGPNNIGKTAVVDALRALLTWQEETFPRFNPDDIHAGSHTTEFSFQYLFTDLSPEEEAEFLPALVPQMNGSFDAVFTIRYYLNDTGEYLKAKRWCGKFEDNAISVEMFENLYAIYLQPLRDVIQGLKPNRLSKQARLLNHITSDKDKEALNELLKIQDNTLQENETIKRVQGLICTQHMKMLGNELSQDLKLGINGSDLNKLVSRLALAVDDLDIDRNGLGYGNLIFMAIVLSELSERSDTLYKTVLIEEPEAHLHPQLQYVLLEYLKSIDYKNDEINQIFVTSHSSNFVCKADVDSLICMYENDKKIHSKAVREISIDSRQKRKLERYLDVTRSELFFAKKILFVEGIAEQILLKALAKKLNYDLDKLGITVVNVEGINFGAFLPLFGENALRVPVAVLTDSDPGTCIYPTKEEVVYPKNKSSLEKLENFYVKVYFARKTFEYDLALEEQNIRVLLSALELIHPGIASKLQEKIDNTGDLNIPMEFFKCVFQDHDTRKGEYAQALAEVIGDSDFVIPEYIQKALAYLLTNKN